MPTAAAAFLAALTFLVPSGAHAQASTQATCPVTYSWMDNAEKQSPCVVAGYLLGVCNPGFVLGALAGGQSSYPLPGGSTFPVSKCSCSSVVYSLLQACSLCQGGTGKPTWGNWKTHCPLNETAVADFLEPIPQNTSVPAWAYTSLSPAESWNITAAMTIVSENQPDHMPLSSPSASITTVYTGTPSSSTIPNPAPPSAGAPVATIVGGVIGGLVAVGLGILGIILALRLTRGAHAKHESAIPRSSFAGTNMIGRASMASGVVTSPAMRSPPFKLYNPDDPSTFPSPPPDSARGSSGHRVQLSASSVMPEV